MPQIDVVEIKRRSKQVTDLINDISLENNRKWIGWKGKVLFDENLDGQVKGRNFAYKPIFVNEITEIGKCAQLEWQMLLIIASLVRS